jgi:hypothetical protein
MKIEEWKSLIHVDEDGAALTAEFGIEDEEAAS